jgi:hypothetical protein
VKIKKKGNLFLVKIKKINAVNKKNSTGTRDARLQGKDRVPYFYYRLRKLKSKKKVRVQNFKKIQKNSKKYTRGTHSCKERTVFLTFMVDSEN